MIARTRAVADGIGFLRDHSDTPERRRLKAELAHNLESLRAIYAALLYGGHMESMVRHEKQPHEDAAEGGAAA